MQKKLEILRTQMDHGMHQPQMQKHSTRPIVTQHKGQAA